ncbi:hypothetical protein KL86DYS1_10545 [uncultured Dysgonomonas sp.]|uniref:Uncharacterized protein n=1 Tax=uncultured Dysgonomonas sp. TaxID=206096 RepID=A0A212IYG3_9BACT|nr:hypothetical protein KL86DYS1_10545 [uncultured Dysgonomonas sp.]
MRLADFESIRVFFVKNSDKKDTILPKCYTIFPQDENCKE